MTAPTPRTRIHRHPERGVHDWATIAAVLDEALFCHLGFVEDGQPFVIPTIHARVGDLLYLHGSPASRMLGELGSGIAACVTATLLDGVVLARSVYKHSLNYRSVVVLGNAYLVEHEDEKRRALEAIVEHVVPGRSAEARSPSEEELTATRVLALALREASAKLRTGPPSDFDRDLSLPIWAGVLPLRTVAGEPVTEERVPEGVQVPGYVSGYARPSGRAPARGTA